MELNKIYQGDCLQVLKTLPAESVHCCVTSPPYFGFRDYGKDGQIGLEETPEIFIQKLTEVFSEVRRVLKKDGTLWLNLGDSYNGQKKGNTETFKNPSVVTDTFEKKLWKGAKAKDLIGIPWMAAFALRADGWYLRQDIIWHKPNPMPESVIDRCTKSHEYIFLLSKSQKYYYDNKAISQPQQESSIIRASRGWNGNGHRGFPNGPQNHLSKYFGKSEEELQKLRDEGANKRSVWTITTKPFKEAHFATFPEDLIVDMIKAGCPENGVVLDCFMGAGTTALVAAKLNRNYVGIELNEAYIEIANKRLNNELGMFKRVG